MDFRAWHFLEDASGDIWMGTRGVGLARYLRANDSIVTYTHDPDNAASLANDTVNAICEDRKGILWFGTRRGIDRFDRTTGTFVHCDQSRGNRVYTIVEDQEQSLWLGTEDGLCRLDGSRTSFERYRNTNRKRDIIRYLFEDSRHDLWVASDSGLARFDRSTNRFMIARASRGNIPIIPSFYTLRPILEDRTGAVWITIDGVGLGMFDREKQALEVYAPNARDRYAVPENTVTTIYEDRLGTLWIGMLNTGVRRVERSRGPFIHIAQNPFDKIQLSNRVVTSILEDTEGTLWVGTSDGLDRLDLTTGTGTHYRADPNDSRSLSNGRILSLAEEAPGKLWVGTSHGLNMLNKATGTFTRFTPDPGKLGNIFAYTVQSICIDRSGTMWLGGGVSNGILQRFNRRDRTFTSYDVRDVGWTGPNAFNICSIHEDRLGVMWFLGRGLGVFDRSVGRATYYRFIPESSGGLSAEGPTSLCEDAQGVLWIGTRAGLDRFDRASGTFSHVTVKDGLPSNQVFGILEDNRRSSRTEGLPGNLWLLTPMGISKYTPSTGAVRNYGPSDGVPIAPSLWARACFKGRNGYMYFGGTNGLVRFHPDSVRDNTHVPPIFLTDLRIANKSVLPGEAGSPLTESITETKHLVLSYLDDMISFEFAALDYAVPEKNQYAYKLEGFDRDWIHSGNVYTATYTNLDPGGYVFRVKGSNNDGIWNEEGASLSITINPPWWTTTWAYLAYVLIIGGLLYSVYRVRMNRLRLAHQLQIEELESTRMHELDRLKSQFFANISHEFRTPLTLILGPARQLLEGSNDEETRTKADLIHRSARRLNRLVDELLDLAKIEAGEMKLSTRPVNVISAVHDVVLTFQPLAERKKITCRCSCDEHEIVAHLDRVKIDKILTNVLSNAFKFTPDGGRVDVSVSVQPSEEGGAVAITIADTGIGIPAEHLDKIFDRFYQVDGSHTREQEGTGIGLALTKELVELHKGRIEVESVEGRGSTFRLIFPLGTAHLKPEEIGGDAGECPHEKATPQADEGVTGTDEHGRDRGVSEKGGLPSLLIVEDNADVRKYVSSILENSYRIIEAQDGEEGFDKSVGCIPDLIITDLMMPKMDGFHLCGKLKADSRTSHIPVIMLTAKATSKDKIDGLESGADDYIMKPFEARELEARIRNLIEQRKRLHEHFRTYGLVDMAAQNVTSVDQKFLRKAMEVVIEHVGDTSFSVEVFAELMAVSRSLLFRKMESLLGEPPSELIRRTRLDRAAKLLEARAGNISEIALEVGFSNPSHFAEGFRKRFGCTPTQYYHNFQNPPSGQVPPQPK